MPHLADFPPMLLDERPLDFDEPGWIYEIKFDGYRVMAEFDRGTVQVRSRNGADATKWFPEITQALGEREGRPVHRRRRDVCARRARPQRL
jgi:bifunctional non-homologous end joining protein LigD